MQLKPCGTAGPRRSDSLHSTLLHPMHSRALPGGQLHKSPSVVIAEEHAGGLRSC